MEKTCGNCNSCDCEAWLCDWIEEDGTRRSVTADTPACEDWEQLRLTEEERIEQLEQLARDMMRYIEFQELRYDTPSTSRKARMYQQLEALGVSLDG